MIHPDFASINIQILVGKYKSFIKTQINAYRHEHIDAHTQILNVLLKAFILN